MADPHPAWDRIEPEARELARHHETIPGEHAIELSKAISLKRIADHLGGMRLSLMRLSGSDDLMGSPFTSSTPES